jgi:Tfp pilus assembly protein PilF
MKAQGARAHFKAGSLTTAEQVCKQVNSERPTAQTLLLEAKIVKERKDYAAAISLLQSAEDILERTGNYGKI